MPRTRAAALLIVALFVAFGTWTAVSGALVQTRGAKRTAANQADGLAAWEQVYTVLTHPRCINCHTAKSYPQQGDDRHRHFANVVRGPDGKGVRFQAGDAFGLSQLMAQGAIALKDGIVEQRNFDGYVPPYMPDAPVAVDVHIVPSGEPPTGCGEPPVPVISPAVVNALSRLTGKRYRSLPLVEV